MLLTRSFSAVTSCLQKLRSTFCTDTGSTSTLDNDVTAAISLNGDVERLLDMSLVCLSADPLRRTAADTTQTNMDKHDIILTG